MGGPTQTPARPQDRFLAYEYGRLKAKLKVLKKRLKAIDQSIGIEELRQIYLNDLYLFARDIMGFKDLSPNLHRRIADFVSRKPGNQKLILIPRGHFKSSLITISYTAWLLTRNPDERIGIVAVTTRLAQDFLREIVERMARPAYQDLFGHIVGHPDDWPVATKDEVRIKRSSAKTGPSIYAYGVESSETGRHFSTMIFDDIVNEQWSSSQDMLNKLWDWFGRQESVLDQPDGRKIVVGTRWHWDDPYSRIQQLKGWECLVLPAIDEKGQILFPERFSKKKLEEIRQLQGDFRFSCFYLNKPVGDWVNPFDPRKLWWKTYTEKDPSAWTYILVDPASTQSQHSCYTGIVIVDALPERHYVVKEAILKRFHPDELINAIFTLVLTHKPQKVILECEAMQYTIYAWLRKEMVERQTFFALEPVHAKRNVSKEWRLVGLQPFLNDGTIRFKRDLPGKDALIEELTTFPRGPHDDLLAALAYLVPHCAFPQRSERPEKTYQRTPESLLERIRKKAMHPEERRGTIRFRRTGWRSRSTNGVTIGPTSIKSAFWN